MFGAPRGRFGAPLRGYVARDQQGERPRTVAEGDGAHFQRQRRAGEGAEGDLAASGASGAGGVERGAGREHRVERLADQRVGAVGAEQRRASAVDEEDAAAGEHDHRVRRRLDQAAVAFLALLQRLAGAPGIADVCPARYRAAIVEPRLADAEPRAGREFHLRRSAGGAVGGGEPPEPALAVGARGRHGVGLHRAVEPRVEAQAGDDRRRQRRDQRAKPPVRPAQPVAPVPHRDGGVQMVGDGLEAGRARRVGSAIHIHRKII